MGLKNISEFNFEDLQHLDSYVTQTAHPWVLVLLLAFMLCQTQSASHKGLGAE